MEILELIIKVHNNGLVSVSKGDNFKKNRMGRPRKKKRATDTI